MIIETELDGVPVFLSPAPGPMRAGLMFRVGRADETLATTGITHLVEHLALYRHGVADYHYNGATAEWITHFAVSGTPEHVVDYLAGVCEALADLPMARLDAEKSILRTEAAGRQRGPVSAMATWRYGAQGQGLLSYPEWGLSRLTADEVRAWASTHFNRSNAVLWLTGTELPAGLSLKLPEGRRMAVPTGAETFLPHTPAYFNEGSGGIAVSAIVPRCAAAQLYAGVLERALFRSLRQEGGYSYTVDAAYSTKGTHDQATIIGYADALPQKQDAVVGAFLDVLAALRAGRIEQSELDSLRHKAEQELGHPEYDAGTLPHRAMSRLVGADYRDADTQRRELAAVTVADVTAIAAQVFDTALFLVPQGTKLDWAGVEQAPQFSTTLVPGRYMRALAADGCGLSIGAEGVSISSPEGNATVRFDDCVALLTWPDGARRLIGRDGINVQVEPTLFDIDRASLASIDAQVSADRTISMPARDAANIPHPDKPQRQSLRKQIRMSAIATAVTAVLITMVVQLGGAWRPSDGELAEKALLWLVFGCAGAALWATFSLLWLFTSWQRRRQDAV
ncbi:putative Zn-dependent peptidase [Allocatelliglobosispora scoriae]|uniref:Putative Zn-dependent peptidase n=1 Tax=Allocatelliglobosispora scoriae TaxID=643052 RepID=A0A841BIG0_9ACTN|nr:insulinase family protein [Allocatelliglobosispora scoriae]MBB5868054.1 putative Zn-dependent peptidase [Allocatelliglobosispora scoriae]